MEDGSEHPICFASRSLTPAENKHSQLDKEALAIVFGVTRFHQYLYGRNFTLLTDHKPLVHLFNHTRSIPQMAASRIQCRNLTLSAYSYTIWFKPGKDNSNADALSRLPLPTSLETIPVPGDILLPLQTLANTPVNAVQIKNWTSRDPLLSKVKLYVQQGWLITQSDVDISPFFRRKDELSIMDGCILWGSRVVIPPLGRCTHDNICNIKGHY